MAMDANTELRWMDGDRLRQCVINFRSSGGWGMRLLGDMKRASERRPPRRAAPRRGLGLGGKKCPSPNFLNFLNFHIVMVAFCHFNKIALLLQC
jgi:hypothetical protein